MPSNLQKRGNIWYVVYHAGGRQYKRSTETGNLSEARRRRDLLLQKLSGKGWRTSRRDPPIEEFEGRFQKWAEIHQTRQTRETQWYRWRAFIEWKNPRTLGSVTRRDLEDFKAYLVKKGAARSTVNNHLRDIKAIYNHAIKDLEMYNGSNPVVGVKRLTVEENAPPFLTLDQIKRVLEEAKKHSQYLYWFCCLGIYAGLRLNEIVNLRWEYFDWDKRVLVLPSAEGATLKSHKGRIVSLADKLIAVLKPHTQNIGYLFESSRRGNGRDRYRYNPKKSFNTVVKRAGVPECTIHWMRHTFCTQLARAGVPVSIIQKEAGHRSIEITQKYIHSDDYNPHVNVF